MSLILILVVVVGLIYVLTKAFGSNRPAGYLPGQNMPPYPPNVIVEPVYPVVENPLLDVAAIAATEVIADTVVNAFEPPPPYPDQFGYGNQNGFDDQNQGNYGGGDFGNDVGGNDFGGGGDFGSDGF